LHPEVLLRLLPRQSGQRWWHLERIDHLVRLLGLLRQPSPRSHGLLDAVLRMALSPSGDIVSLSLLLALGRGADALAITGERMRQEPATTDPARTRPKHPAVMALDIAAPSDARPSGAIRNHRQ
jgi:hypothetical protein